MMCGLDCCSDEQRRAVIRICEALINKERRKLKARGIYHSPPSLSPPAWWEILAGSWSFLKCAMFEFNDVDIRSHVPNDHQTAWTYSFLIRIYWLEWNDLTWTGLPLWGQEKRVDTQDVKIVNQIVNLIPSLSESQTIQGWRINIYINI